VPAMIAAGAKAVVVGNAKRRTVAVENIVTGPGQTSLAEGEIVEAKFTVTNSGKTDLVISNVQPSCGCTVPVWPRTPIKPGDSADVLANFNTAGKPNRQAKTLTLYTNTARGREILKLKGSVTPKASSTAKK